MPYLNHRGLVKKPDGLIPLHRVKLETGFWYPEILDGDAIDDEALRSLWEQYGSEILRDHITNHPGSRPWGWWRWDSPEQRKRVVPGAPYTHYHRPASFGVPKNCDPEEFESERAYLARLNLLTPQERDASNLRLVV